MQKIIILIVLFIAIIACENREPDPVITPEWLQDRITELEDSGCTGCSVTRVTYNEEFYYQVYCNYWSCANCEVYHYNGELVDWQETDFADYLAYKTNQIKLWECGGSEADD